MVLQEIEHVALQTIHTLPTFSKCWSWWSIFHDFAQTVVKIHLIVKIIETAIVDIIVINAHIIKFGNENYRRISLFHFSNSPMPKIYWHHVSHIATETVNAFWCPVKQNVAHFLPCGWNGGEVVTTVPRIHTIVQLHCFIPVVHARVFVVAVVASSFGGKFHISVIALTQIHIWRKFFTCDVEEIVWWRKKHTLVVGCAQILHSAGLGIGMIFTRHMVWHEVDNHLHTIVMGAVHEIFKLMNAIGHIYCYIGVNVVIVANSVRRAGVAFHHMRIRRLNAILRIVGFSGMFNHTSVPHVCNA